MDLLGGLVDGVLHFLKSTLLTTSKLLSDAMEVVLGSIGCSLISCQAVMGKRRWKLAVVRAASSSG